MSARTKAEEELANALQIASIKRTLKRLPRISKRSNVSLRDLFPDRKSPPSRTGLCRGESAERGNVIERIP